VAPIYTFSGADGGGMPFDLTVDSDGALYGTTQTGGAHNLGVVFKLTPPAPGTSRWTETVLHSFAGPDGANPYFKPTLDSQGALYGATILGGINNLGVAFKLTPPVAPSTRWTETKIFDFTSAIGSSPAGAFVLDSAGALYGTTQQGTVFKLTPPVPPAMQWTGVALYTFPGGMNGVYAGLMLVMDTSGALYGGTTAFGGSGTGVVFKLSPPGADCTPTAPNLWCETVLYSFLGGADGAQVIGGVTMDSHGALYGAAVAGGAYDFGLVFKLTPPTPPSTQWTITTLYSFTGYVDGGSPSAPVIAGGVLYGTTARGMGCSPCGAIYQLRPPVPPSTQWTENTLWTSTGGGGIGVGDLTFGPVDYGLGVAVYGVGVVNPVTNPMVFSLQCAPRAREVFGGGGQTACAQ
jgi:uncharacterized repeat protein (TIGR03803 family)